MASADTLIVRDGPVAVPLDYNQPAGSEIVPVCATATFDGASAASGFLPALEVIAPDGRVVARCPTDVSVAAGASADVTWFPGITPLPSSSAVLPGTGVDRELSSQVVPNNVATNISFDTVLFDDLGWFNPATPTVITVTIPGQYLCIYTMAWVYPAGGGFPIQSGINYNAGARSLVSEQTSAAANTPNAHTGAAVVNGNAGDTFALFVYQISGGNMSTWIAGSHAPDVQPIPTLSVIRIGDRV